MNVLSFLLVEGAFKASSASAASKEQNQSFELKTSTHKTFYVIQDILEDKRRTSDEVYRYC